MEPLSFLIGMIVGGLGATILCVGLFLVVGRIADSMENQRQPLADTEALVEQIARTMIERDRQENGNATKK